MRSRRALIDEQAEQPAENFFVRLRSVLPSILNVQWCDVYTARNTDVGEGMNLGATTAVKLPVKRKWCVSTDLKFKN